MTYWTPGDVDGGQTLTDNDHRKVGHVNELREGVKQISLNVKNYGATGDGVTDDSVAVQEAVDDLSFTTPLGTYSAGLIYFPRGYYRLDNIVLPQYTHIMGNGLDTIIGNYTSAGKIFTYTGHVYQVEIDHIYFHGDGEAYSGDISEGYSVETDIHHCLFRADLRECIKVPLMSSNIHHNNFGYVGTPNPLGHRHLCLDGDTTGHPNSNYFSHNRFYKSNANEAVYINQGQHQVFTHNNFEANTNTTTLFNTFAAFMVKFDSNWFERNESPYLVQSTGGTPGGYTSYIVTFDNNIIHVHADTTHLCNMVNQPQLTNFNFIRNYLTTMSGKYYTKDTVNGLNNVRISDFHYNNEAGTLSTFPERTTMNGSILFSGAGSPEGAVTAPIGSLFMRSDGGAGTSLYVKQTGTGNTGWVGK